jgi:hypothetical protein
MNKLSKKTAVLLAIGMFIISAAQIISHKYKQLPDLYSGLLAGVGIGLMILALMRSSVKHSH